MREDGLSRREFVGATLSGIAVLVLGLRGQEAQGAETGVLKDTILFEGGKAAAPEMRVLDMKEDEWCVEQQKKNQYRDVKFVINDAGAVQNVLVYIKKGLDKSQKYEPPAEKVVMDQRNCRHWPHVLALMTGQTLLVRNSDDTQHTVHGLPFKNKEFNISQAKRGMEKELSFKREEVFKIVCDPHPWESAYVGVFAHPFFSVTDENGQYEIKNLPPGEYTLAVWHEVCGEFTRTITFAPGETKELNLTISPKRRKRKRGRT